MWSAQTDDQLIEFHAHSPALYSTNIRDQCFYGGPVHCTAETMEYQRSECWHLHARVRPLDDFPLQVSEAPVQTRISMFIFQRTWFMAIIRIRNWIHEAIVGRYVSSNCRTRIFYIFFFSVDSAVLVEPEKSERSGIDMRRSNKCFTSLK